MKVHGYPQKVEARIQLLVWGFPPFLALILVGGVFATWPAVPLWIMIPGFIAVFLSFPIGSQLLPYQMEIRDDELHLLRIGFGRLVLHKSRITGVKPARYDTVVTILACTRVVYVFVKGYRPTGHFYVGATISDFDELLTWLESAAEDRD